MSAPSTSKSGGEGSSSKVLTMQEKTFSRWCNIQLEPRNIVISSLVDQLKDCEVFIGLVEVLSKKSVGKYEKNPTKRIQLIENANIGLRFLLDQKVKLVGVGGSDIVDGNPKLINNLVWTLISHYQIQNSSGKSAKDELMVWLKDILSQAPNLTVANFKASFLDGMIFCYLVQQADPTLLDISTLDTANVEDNLNLAFDLAEKHLGIPKLLEFSDFTEERIDDLSIMTYLSYFRSKIQSKTSTPPPTRKAAEQPAPETKQPAVSTPPTPIPEKKDSSVDENSNQTIRELHTKIASQAEQLQTSEDKKQQLNKEVEELKAQLLAKSDIIEGIEKKMTKDEQEAMQTIAQMSESMKAFEENLREKEAVIDQTQKKVEGLELDLKNKGIEYSKISEELNQGKSVIKELEEKLKTQTSLSELAIKEKEDHIQTILNQLQQTNNEKEGLNKSVLKLEENLKEREVNISQLLENVKSLEVVVNQKQAGLDEASSTIQSLRTEKENIEQENQRLSSDLEEKNGAIQALEEDNEWLREREDELKSQSRDEKKRLEDKIFSLEQSFTSFKTSAEEKQQEVQDLHQDLDYLKRRMVEQQANFDSVNRERLEALHETSEEIRFLMDREQELKVQLQGALTDNKKISKQVETLLFKVEVCMQEAKENKASNPILGPEGRVTFVHTEIGNSEKLWEVDPEVMAKAIVVHNKILRDLLKRYNGYEARAEGESFALAFDSPENALLFCGEVQKAMLKANWPPELRKLEGATDEYYLTTESKDVGSSSQLLYRGLRVRMGVHLGEPLSQIDPEIKRTEYLGPVVKRAEQVVNVSYGGQIVITSEFWNAIEKLVLEENSGFQFVDLGRHQLKGMDSEENFFQLLPTVLAGRVFPSIDTQAAADVRRLQDEVKMLKEANDMMKSKLTDLEKRFEQTTLASSNIKGKLKQLGDEFSSTSSYQSGNPNDSRFSEQISKTLEEVNQLMVQQQQHKSELEKAQQEGSVLNQNINELTAQLGFSQTQLEDMRFSREELRNQVSRLKKELYNQRLKSEKKEEEIKGEIKKAEDKIKQQELDLQETREEIEWLNQREVELKEQIHSLSSTTKKAEMDKISSMKELTSQEKVLQDLKKQHESEIDSTLHSMKSLEHQKIQLELEKSHLLSLLKSSETKYLDLQGKLKDLQRTQKGYKTQLHEIDSRSKSISVNRLFFWGLVLKDFKYSNRLSSLNLMKPAVHHNPKPKPNLNPEETI